MAIDVHAHYVPPKIIDVLESQGERYGVDVVVIQPSCQKCLSFNYGVKVRPFFPKLVEPASRRIEWMHETGLERQILSVWTDIFGYGLDLERRVAWHRLLNDQLAEFCAAHPNSFSWLASGPLPDAAKAAEELHRAVRQGGAVGGVCATNVEGVNLGELSLDEYWAAAEELNVPIFLHPAQAVPAPRTGKYGLSQVAQYTFDTTCCIGSLMGAGVLDRFPNLRLIASHGGGNLPMLLGRFDVMFKRADPAASHIVAKRSPSEYMRRFWVDTIVHHPKVLNFVADLIGKDRLVLGTDESFPPHEADPLGALRQAGFSDRDVELVTLSNPREVFERAL